MSDWDDPVDRRPRRRDRKDRRYADELPIFRSSSDDAHAPDPDGWSSDEGGWSRHDQGDWSGQDLAGGAGDDQDEWAGQQGHWGRQDEGDWSAAPQDEWVGRDEGEWAGHEQAGWGGQEEGAWAGDQPAAGGWQEAPPGRWDAGPDDEGPPGGAWGVATAEHDDPDDDGYTYAYEGTTAGGRAEADDAEELSIFGGAAAADPVIAADGVVYVQHREPRRAARWLLVLGTAFAMVAVVVGAGFLWVDGQIDPGEEPGDEVALTIPSGTSTDGIAELLEEEGVVGDATIFSLYVRTQGGGPFQAGEYVLRENMAMGDVVEELGRGPEQVVAGRITVPEGLVLGEIAELVGENPQFSAEELLRIAEGGSVRSQLQPADKPLEGLLFPETYTLDGNEDETELLQRMVDQFDATAQELGYPDAPARVGLTPYETVIVASLIEAEAKDDADRRKISRVIHNRLEEGMPLGIDATFYYALGRRGGSLTQSDLEIDSPYNTRENAGLVPTPIGAPGAASLAAAIDPEPGPWLYYVLQDERTHAFSESYDEFLQNRRRAQQEGLIP